MPCPELKNSSAKATEPPCVGSLIGLRCYAAHAPGLFCKECCLRGRLFVVGEAFIRDRGSLDRGIFVKTLAYEKFFGNFLLCGGLEGGKRVTYSRGRGEGRFRYN